MNQLHNILKYLGLLEFYLSLSIEDKNHLAKYSKFFSCYPIDVMSYSFDCEEFSVSNGAQFLWASAANAICEKKFDFAERILNHALTIAIQIEDIAWIHANLAEIYYEKQKTETNFSKKCIHHCKELIQMGFMKKWAKAILKELVPQKSDNLAKNR